MASSLLLPDVLDANRRAFLLGAVAVPVLAASVFAENLLAYLCIAIPALIPFALWLRAGAAGMPVLPAISGLFFVYYAVPLLRGKFAGYGSDEILSAGVTVGSFLVAATLAGWPFLRRPRRNSEGRDQNFVSEAQIVSLVFIGLGGGIVYYLAIISGRLDWLGPSLGLVRAVVLTLTSVACYLLGYARAARLLYGSAWALALVSLMVLIVLSFSNLFLVGGVMNCIAAFLGYIFTAKRIPWISLGIAFAFVAVLHAGKFEMRKRYWMPRTQSLAESSIGQVPGMTAEWIVVGIDTMWSDQTASDVLERASLLHMLLLVQRATPGYVPYLEGETYALLPAMLLPRFVEPDKIESQAGLNLLSVRYGLQSIESTQNTTIGWGLIAEAYANFGNWGVIGAGAIFGAICGAFMWLSVGATANSLPMFITIAATLILFNLEADFAYLLTTLGQTLVAVLLFAGLPNLLGRRRRAAVPPTAAIAQAGSPFGELPS